MHFVLASQIRRRKEEGGRGKEEEDGAVKKCIFFSEAYIPLRFFIKLRSNFTKQGVVKKKPSHVFFLKLLRICEATRFALLRLLRTESEANTVQSKQSAQAKFT